MKRLFCLLCACALCCLPCLAAEEDGVEGAVAADPTSTPIPQPFQVEVTLIDGNPAPEASPSPSAPVLEDEATLAIMETLERIDANTQGDALAAVSSPSGSVSSLAPEPTTREGLAGVVADLFGPYTPRTYTTSTYINGEVVTGMEIVPGLAGLDWYWLCGVALFAIMVYCLFRLLGGVWK